VGDQVILRIAALMLPAALAAGAADLGIFEGHSDVGTVLHPGSAQYDAPRGVYTVSGSGENMWFARDEFHYLWKRVSGDFAFSATVSIVTPTGDAHRKAVLMFRQSLDGDSAYGDVALHADGLTSLQSRDERGAVTREVQSNVSAPVRLRIERRGEIVSMMQARQGEEFRPAGAMRVPLTGPFYVGLGVCAHNKDAMTTAVFSNVELSPLRNERLELYSTIETVPVTSADRRVVHVTRGRIRAPRWSEDGNSILFELEGSWRIPAAGGVPEPVETDLRGGGFTLPEIPRDDFRNFLHNWSPDNSRIAFLSARTSGSEPPEDADMLLRMMVIASRKVTVIARFDGGRSSLGVRPWSPDGRRLLFVSYHWRPRT